MDKTQKITNSLISKFELEKQNAIAEKVIYLIHVLL